MQSRRSGNSKKSPRSSRARIDDELAMPPKPKPAGLVALVVPAVGQTGQSSSGRSRCAIPPSGGPVWWTRPRWRRRSGRIWASTKAADSRTSPELIAPGLIKAK